MEQFTSRFGNELWDKLDFISNDKHDYLKNHSQSLRSRNNLLASQISVSSVTGSGDIRDSLLPTDSIYDSSDFQKTLSDDSDHENPNSKFAELVSKLNKIKSAQKSRIVIIGQRRIVRYIIRKIRELEVEHPAMKPLTRIPHSENLPFLSPEGDSGHEAMLLRGRAASTLVMYTILVENIPPGTSEEEMIDFFKEYGQILDITLKNESDLKLVNTFKGFKLQKAGKGHKKSTKSEVLLDKTLSDNDEDENETGSDSDGGGASSGRSSDTGGENENENDKGEKAIAGGSIVTHNTVGSAAKEEAKLGAMIGQIAFETQSALDRVIAAAESANGLEFRGYMLIVKSDSVKTIVELIVVVCMCVCVCACMCLKVV